MHAPLDEIIACIQLYVSGKVDRKEYRAWLAEQVWRADELDDLRTENLLFEIESLDAEFTSGHWSEKQLRDELHNRYIASHLKRPSA